MKIAKSLFFALAIFAASVVVAAGQVIIRVQPVAEQQNNRPNDDRDYTALLREVFAPITDELNLTSEQRFKIVAIVTATVLKADPLMDKLDDLDAQLDEAAVAEPFDNARIRQLAAQQAELMGQIIAMKARARASMYRLLTPGQRTIVARQFRIKPQAEGSLGAISNQ